MVLPELITIIPPTTKSRLSGDSFFLFLFPFLSGEGICFLWMPRVCEFALRIIHKW